jgi:hypothetical protein
MPLAWFLRKPGCEPKTLSSADINASGLVCSKGSASSVEAVSIAAAVTVMAAQPTREAPPTTAIFPFLLISIPLFVLRAGGRMFGIAA